MMTMVEKLDGLILRITDIHQNIRHHIGNSNGVPDFYPVSEAIVSIGNMVSDRYKKDGNFKQADTAFAEYLNENPNCELYERIGCNGTVTWEDVKAYRDANDLTWHEEGDGVHMDLVSQDVNAVYGHLGGTAEQKRSKKHRPGIGQGGIVMRFLMCVAAQNTIILQFVLI